MYGTCEKENKREKKRGKKMLIELLLKFPLFVWTPEFCRRCEKGKIRKTLEAG